MNRLAATLLIAAALLAGWIAGSLWPLRLWPGADCHRLGGTLQALPDGPGKPTQCVIPWDDQ